MNALVFLKQFEVRWADLDPNCHLRHTAYNDYATHVRFSYLAENGFGAARFGELQIGPVVFREETKYLKEVYMGETISVNFLLAGLAQDGSRWKLWHDVFRADGAHAAIIILEGAWLDLKKRKLTVPPDELTSILKRLPKTSDYEDIPLSK